MTDVPGRGNCLAPFLEETYFPYTGGFRPGRYCAPLGGSGGGNITCCLPCPLVDWVYPDNFSRLSVVSNWLNVGSVACCAILLLSFLVLPVQTTHRHYLTLGLVTAVGLLSLSSLIPLASNPNQCHDAITPNDMYSDISCAFSGSLVCFGGFAAVMWVFLRSLSLHLQICWKVVPGKKFFLGSQLAGWGIPAISLALLLAITGVSYRFSVTCQINHDRSVQTFWGPLLAFTGAAAILQFVTFGYCIRVYIRSLLNPNDGTSQNSSNLPSYHGSVRTVTAKAAYRRVQKVIALQWRGMVIVMIIIVDVVLFSTVFVKMDNEQQAGLTDKNKTLPWLLCLVLANGDHDKCLPEAQTLVVTETTVMAVLFLLAVNGFWCVFFLGRWKMVLGWLSFFRSVFHQSHDFVSVDARRISDPRNYEMLTSPPQHAHLPKDYDDTIVSPNTDIRSPTEWSSPKQEDGYFGNEAEYRSPTLSFSTPKPPSRAGSDATRIGSGREQFGGSKARDYANLITVPEPALGNHGSHPALAHVGTDSVLAQSRSNSALGRERTGSALSWDRGSPVPLDRAGSALGRERGGLALGRGRDAGVAQPRPIGSPSSTVPRRQNSALGRGDWDPRRTYARGGASTPDRTDSGWNYETSTRGSGVGSPKP